MSNAKLCGPLILDWTTVQGLPRRWRRPKRSLDSLFIEQHKFCSATGFKRESFLIEWLSLFFLNKTVLRLYWTSWGECSTRHSNTFYNWRLTYVYCFVLDRVWKPVDPCWSRQDVYGGFPTMCSMAHASYSVWRNRSLDQAFTTVIYQYPLKVGFSSSALYASPTTAFWRFPTLVSCCGNFMPIPYFVAHIWPLRQRCCTAWGHLVITFRRWG